MNLGIDQNPEAGTLLEVDLDAIVVKVNNLTDGFSFYRKDSERRLTEGDQAIVIANMRIGNYICILCKHGLCWVNHNELSNT